MFKPSCKKGSQRAKTKRAFKDTWNVVFALSVLIWNLKHTPEIKKITLTCPQLNWYQKQHSHLQCRACESRLHHYSESKSTSREENIQKMSFQSLPTTFECLYWLSNLISQKWKDLCCIVAILLSNTVVILNLTSTLKWKNLLHCFPFLEKWCLEWLRINIKQAEAKQTVLCTMEKIHIIALTYLKVKE